MICIRLPFLVLCCIWTLTRYASQIVTIFLVFLNWGCHDGSRISDFKSLLQYKRSLISLTTHWFANNFLYAFHIVNLVSISIVDIIYQMIYSARKSRRKCRKCLEAYLGFVVWCMLSTLHFTNSQSNLLYSNCILLLALVLKSQLVIFIS